MHVSSLIPTYNRLPVAFVEGQGCWLTDHSGKRYLDALSGIAVTNLGHAHPRLNEVLQAQQQQLWHTSNLYQMPLQETLAERLCAVAQMQAVFFCNSGAEANEAAIKLARLHANEQGTPEAKIVVFQQSFHGRTMGALAATGNDKVKQGFAPLLSGFLTLEYNNVAALKQAAKQHVIAAILFEPVQGEGGINIAESNFMQAIAELAEQQNCLLICDEVQCGMGRTGQWFRHHCEGIQCDVMTVAKALGNGFPIGACLVNHKASALFAAGKHGTTFGGNPLASVVATEVINIIEQQNLLQRVVHLSQLFATKLQSLSDEFAGITAIRQAGLMLGIELQEQQFRLQHIVATALQYGLLINLTAGNVVRLLPPFIMQDVEVDLVCQRLRDTLKATQV